MEIYTEDGSDEEGLIPTCICVDPQQISLKVNILGCNQYFLSINSCYKYTLLNVFSSLTPASKLFFVSICGHMSLTGGTKSEIWIPFQETFSFRKYIQSRVERNVLCKLRMFYLKPIYMFLETQVIHSNSNDGIVPYNKTTVLTFDLMFGGQELVIRDFDLILQPPCSTILIILTDQPCSTFVVAEILCLCLKRSMIFDPKKCDFLVPYCV